MVPHIPHDRTPAIDSQVPGWAPPPAWLGLLALVLGLGCADPPDSEPRAASLWETVNDAASAVDPMIRAETMRVLAKSGLPEAVSLLRRATDDPNPRVRAAAMAAWLDLQPDAAERELLGRVSSGSVERRQEAFFLGLRLASEDLRERLFAGAEQEQLRLFQRVAQGGAHPSTDDLRLLSDDLLLRIRNEEPTLATEITRLLMERAHVPTRDEVHRALASAEPERRRWALRVLAVTPSLSAWPHLRWLLTLSADGPERDLATLALARLGDATARPRALAILQDVDGGFTIEALSALAGTEDGGLQEAIEVFLSDEEHEVRRAALGALLQLGLTPQELVTYLTHPRPETARTVADHLIRANPAQVASSLCERLQSRARPLPSLRVLWALLNERRAVDAVSSCREQVAQLASSDDIDTRGLASRLLMSLIDLEPQESHTRVSEPVEVLYAYLDETLVRTPGDFQPLYRALLKHDLLAIRMMASIGLLRAAHDE